MNSCYLFSFAADVDCQPVQGLKAVLVNSSSVVLTWEKPVDVTDSSDIKVCTSIYYANLKPVNTSIISGMLWCCEEKANQMQDENTASCNGKWLCGFLF